MALAGNMLQLTTLLQPRSAIAMASNALDFTALLRWSATRCTPGQRCAAVFFYFFIFTRQLQEKKRKRTGGGALKLVQRSQLCWLAGI
jgi:hypothetical protein